MYVTVALAQTSAEAQLARAEAKAEGLMAEAKARGAQIICFPEMWLEVFFPQYRADRRFFRKAEPVPGPLVERFQERAARIGINTIVNVYEKAAPGRFYNCSAIIDSSGNLRGTSRMMHIPELPNYNENFYYWPGDTDYPVFSVGNAVIGVPTCWDRHFPEVYRILALKGAQVILIPTAGSTIPAFQHLWELEIQASSAANQIFVGIANRVGAEEHMTFFGGSFFSDPAGNVISRAALGEEDLLVTKLDLGQIDEMRELCPFLKNRRPSTYDGLLRY